MLKLYEYYRSSASFRVRIALNLKGLKYDVIPVHLLNNGGEQFSEKYDLINPQHLVPSLEDDTRFLTQSLAIIEYLDETHPSPALLPNNPYQKALVRSFALTIAADVHPLNNLRVLKYLTNELSVTEEQKSSWYKHWITVGLSSLETQLKRWQVSGSYCFGNTPTLADICLVPQLYNARRFACPLDDFPTLVSIDAFCRQQSAFSNAWPVEPATEKG